MTGRGRGLSAATALLLLGPALLLGGCARPAGRTELTIAFDNGRGKPATWRLTCDPEGGNHPDPKAACQALDLNGASALPAVPQGRVCTQVFGGPATAVLSGSWHGQAVNSRLDLTNGCQIARWHSLEGLLPRIGS
jgi:hypothetical protein